MYDSFESFLMGVLSCLGFWWIWNRWIKPSVKFGAYIIKAPFPTRDRFIYRIKIENSSLFRDIIDLETMITLNLKPIKNYPKDNYHVVRVPLTTDGEIIDRTPMLRKGKKFTLWLYLNDIPELTTEPFYPNVFVEKSLNNSLLLEDFRECFPESYLKVYVLGYDSFSGVRKVFDKKYKLTEIV